MHIAHWEESSVCDIHHCGMWYVVKTTLDLLTWISLQAPMFPFSSLPVTFVLVFVPVNLFICSFIEIEINLHREK